MGDFTACQFPGASRHQHATLALAFPKSMGGLPHLLGTLAPDHQQAAEPLVHQAEALLHLGFLKTAGRATAAFRASCEEMILAHGALGAAKTAHAPHDPEALWLILVRDG